ncbi:MAG: NAD(P)-dependent oxidoreductase [bacterium]
MKRILVTGGLGFIGLYLVRKLLALSREADCTIHVVDDLRTSPLTAEQARTFWPDAGRVTLHTDSVEHFMDSYGGPPFHEVYHLASIVGPARVLHHGGTILDSISQASRAVVEHVSRAGGKLAYISTSEVYGGGHEGECREDMSCVISSTATARLEYAVAKLAIEVALRNLCRRKGVAACVIRPFNVAGPRQSCMGGFVVPRFVSQALTHRPLTLYGDGSQVRALTHVEDFVRGMMLVMERGQACAIYNIGNPANRVTMRELAASVIEVTGSPSRIECCDPRDLHGPEYAEATDKYPNADLLISLGWKPRMDTRRIVRDSSEFLSECDDDLFFRLTNIAGSERHGATPNRAADALRDRSEALA